MHKYLFCFSFFNHKLYHMNENIKYLPFWFWFNLSNMMITSSIHFYASGTILIFHMTEYFSIGHIPHFCMFI